MIRQPSVQDVSWFIDLSTREQLDLNPPYQRRSVWTIKDRRYFLDTIFRNYPCPPIFIHKTMNENGSSKYHIVDGKQRIETILLFAENKIALPKDYGDNRLDGKKFKDLDPDLKKTFWNYSVPVDFIDIDGLDIKEVFDRVNRNSRNLERQELRHARYDGWFINEVESEADDDPFWEDIGVTTKAKAKRMKNVQLVSELLLIIVDNKIVGFEQDYLDDKYAQLDNLEEENEDFDFDLYKQTKQRVKATLRKFNDINNSIDNHCKTAYNLYTLFAYATLFPIDENEIPNKADIYNSFMALVDIIRKSENPDELIIDGIKPDNFDLAYRYFNNSKGAHTDFTQRNERLNVLKDVLS